MTDSALRTTQEKLDLIEEEHYDAYVAMGEVQLDD